MRVEKNLHLALSVSDSFTGCALQWRGRERLLLPGLFGSPEYIARFLEVIYEFPKNIRLSGTNGFEKVLSGLVSAHGVLHPPRVSSWPPFTTVVESGGS